MGFSGSRLSRFSWSLLPRGVLGRWIHISEKATHANVLSPHPWLLLPLFCLLRPPLLILFFSYSYLKGAKGSETPNSSHFCLPPNKCSPGGSDSKESACSAGGLGSVPGLEDPLKKEMATHSSILAWEVPQTEEPGGLQFMGSQRVRPNWAHIKPVGLCLDIGSISSLMLWTC